MKFDGRAFGLLAAMAAAAACSNGTSTLSPIRIGPTPAGTGQTAKPTSKPTATATPTSTPSAGATPNLAAANTAAQSAQTMFAALPHQNLHTDLTTLAAQLVSSGALKSASVTYGGISAKLPDGSTFVIFADHPEALGYVPGASPNRAAIRAHAALHRESSGPSGHEVAIMINTDDTSGAFAPSRQDIMGAAFQAVEGSSPGYNVDVEDISLDNIVALGANSIDFMSIATHGMVYENGANLGYANASTTSATSTTTSKYLGDVGAGNIFLAVTLQYPTVSGTLPVWAFTPSFLTSHLHFNPGAIVDNQSCFGASPATLSSVTSVLGGAGVGRYTGWTKEVAGDDADQTDAFILDRMLGETSPSGTGLDALAQQQSPPQRPFPLDDIETIMTTENRAGPLGTGSTQLSEPYAQSDTGSSDNDLAPPLGDGPLARWVATDLGGEAVASPPDWYGIPSIARMFVTSETAGGGTLDINGRFPTAQGSVQILDGSVVNLPIVSWSKTDVVVTLPPVGTGSKGLVLVTSALGVESNTAPITQWSGTGSYLEGDSIDSLGGVSGSGNGGFTIDFAFTFRSDVHPTVPTIDASPVPQNLYFPNVEGNSTATISNVNGTFTSAEGTPPPATATFAQSGSGAMTPAALPLSAGTFIIGALTGQPAPCNNGTSGPEGDAGNVFCPGFGFFGPSIGTCTPDDSDPNLCGDGSQFSPTTSFGAPSLVGTVTEPFTMDPSTYAISVPASTDDDFTRDFKGNPWPASATITLSVGGPSDAPTSTTPASRTRRLSTQSRAIMRRQN